MDLREGKAGEDDVVLPTKVANSTRRERQKAARLYSGGGGGGVGRRRAARLGMYRERAPAGKKAPTNTRLASLFLLLLLFIIETTIYRLRQQQLV